MVLEGPSIKDQLCEFSKPAALSIVQILKYKSVKHMRKQVDAISSLHHSSTQEKNMAIIN